MNVDKLLVDIITDNQVAILAECKGVKSFYSYIRLSSKYFLCRQIIVYLTVLIHPKIIVRLKKE